MAQVLPLTELVVQVDPGTACESDGREAQGDSEQDPEYDQDPKLQVATGEPVYPLLQERAQVLPLVVAQLLAAASGAEGWEVQETGSQDPVYDQDPEAQVATGEPLYPVLQVRVQVLPLSVEQLLVGLALETEG